MKIRGVGFGFKVKSLPRIRGIGNKMEINVKNRTWCNQ